MAESSYDNGDFWYSFQKDLDTGEQEPPPLGYIISDVLDTFDIPSVVDTGIFSKDAGKLKNIDLKRVAPLPTIKASLLEQFSVSDKLIEMGINEDGEVYLYEAGSGNFSTKDIYFTIPSHTYKTPKVGVQVTGATPKIERKVFPWKRLIGPDPDPDTSVNKEDRTGNHTIWSTKHLDTNCVLTDFTTQTVITYQDPLLERGNSGFSNGVANLFEVENIYERIVGFAWKILPPEGIVTDLTKIAQQNSSSVPIFISSGGQGLLPEQEKPSYKIGDTSNYPDIGKNLRKRDIASGTDLCSTIDTTPGQSEDALHIKIPIKEGLTYTLDKGTVVNKFVGISQVFVVAVELESCRGGPFPGKASEPENPATWVSASSIKNNIYTLKEGIDYLLFYPDEAQQSDYAISIQFADNSRYYDNAVFGTQTVFYVDITSALASLFLPEGQQLGEGEIGLVGTGTLLPTNNDGSGLLVTELWAQVTLDTPSFVINDPTGKARDIAEELIVELTAISMIQKEPPLAINGELIIHKEEDIPDNDPTTVQVFKDTEYQRAVKKMDSGRTLSTALASLDEAQTVLLSKNLYELMVNDTGAIYNHTCSPNAKPGLGQTGPNGGIINTISYNYQDQGSYLINVTEGSKYFGDFAGLSGGIHYKKVEEVSAVGTIIQDLGNHKEFVVRVDGYGDIYAINSYPGILDVKDRVSVVIYNNEVED